MKEFGRIPLVVIKGKKTEVIYPAEGPSGDYELV